MWIEFIIKYGILAATYPIWGKIMRALWGELQGTLWREGGLIGAPPTERELEVLEERYRNYASPLTNQTREEWTQEQARRKLESKNPRSKKSKSDEDPGDGTGKEIKPAARRGGSAGSGPGRGTGRNQGGAQLQSQARPGRQSGGRVARRSGSQTAGGARPSGGAPKSSFGTSSGPKRGF